MQETLNSEDNKQNKETHNSWSIISYLWPNDWNIRFRVIISLIFLVLSKVTLVYMPFFYKKAIDQLGSDNITLSIVTGTLIAYGIARIGSQIFNELRDLSFAKVGQRAIRTIALEVFKHMHQLSLRFHISRKTGGVTRAIERGSKGIESILRFSLWNILPTIVEIILVSGILWYNYGPIYVVITLATIFSYIYFTLKISNWRITFVRKMNNVDNETSSKAVDSLLNFETVKYFCNEQFEANQFETSLKAYEDAAVKNYFGLSILNIGQSLILSLGLVLVMYFSAEEITHNKMTVGDFVLITSYILQIAVPLYLVGYAYREIKAGIIHMEDMFKLLNIDQEIKNSDTAKTLKVTNSIIKFNNVDFSYESNRQILYDVNFEIGNGQKLAIVGSTGSGKSTISRLLFRFYEINSGKITIDGQDIREVSQESLRSAIGIVPQDTVLFNDTIFYNIFYGDHNASKEDVINAAKTAHIHHFIESLPDGYDTMVGERGLKLSGGEKQRIAIARTALKNPNIYVFDEATSALDTKTEKAIQHNLREVSENHTTIIIAHRLSTIVDADQIIVLDEGKIIEIGNHKLLIDKKGMYYKLWQKQSEEQENQE